MRHLSKRRLVTGALGAALVVLGGCATTGTVAGEAIENGAAKPVTLAWKSDVLQPTRGTIWGQMPDGHEYVGRFFAIKRTIPLEILNPLWTDWTVGWTDWPVTWREHKALDNEAPRASFVEVYSNHAAAQLQRRDGKAFMRCRFTLDAPTKGLAGGGSGECQVNNGGRIEHAVIAPPAPATRLTRR